MILDSSAIMAIILRETEREAIIDALLSAQEIAISAATLLEARVVAQRSMLPQLEQDVIDLIEDHAVLILPMTASQQELAAAAHRQYGRGSGHPARLNFGDCFSYALAKEKGQPLLFKGNDFTQTDIESAL